MQLLWNFFVVNYITALIVILYKCSLVEVLNEGREGKLSQFKFSGMNYSDIPSVSQDVYIV